MKKGNFVKKALSLLLLSFVVINYESFLNGMELQSKDIALAEINDYSLFKTIKNLQEIVDKSIDENIANKNLSFVQKGSEGWPESNPYYYQTEKGLFLTIINDVPSYISTPWGEVKLTGSYSGNFKPVSQELLKHLKTELLSDRTDKYGWNTKLYKVLAFDGIHLPVPQEQKDLRKQREYKAVKNAWKKLEERYKIEKFAPKSLKELTIKKLQESQEGKEALEELKKEYMIEK